MGLKVGDRVALYSGSTLGRSEYTEYGVIVAIFTDKCRYRDCLVTFWGDHPKPPNDSSRYYTLRYYETSLKKVGGVRRAAKPRGKKS